MFQARLLICLRCLTLTSMEPLLIRVSHPLDVNLDKIDPLIVPPATWKQSPTAEDLAIEISADFWQNAMDIGPCARMGNRARRGGWAHAQSAVLLRVMAVNGLGRVFVSWRWFERAIWDASLFVGACGW